MNRRSSTRALIQASVLTLLLLGSAQAGPGNLATSTAPPDEARFRFSTVEGRVFDYNTDYWIDLLSYRTRIPYRWRYDDYWEYAPIAYQVTAGSVTAEELFVDQRVRVRYPLADWLTGEYRFVDTDDYDGEIERHDVEILIRFNRPEGLAPLTDIPYQTPSPDGFFAGITGFVEQEKEFADMGLVLGWRGHYTGYRLDIVAPGFFFGGKNDIGGQFETDPYSIRFETRARSPAIGLRGRAWVAHQLPMELVLLQRQGGTEFDFTQLRGGFDVGWDLDRYTRIDLNVWAERTDSRRRSPNSTVLEDDNRTDRLATRSWIQFERDFRPALAEDSSRPVDTMFVTLHYHWIDERIARPRLVDSDATLRRGEFYGELGYTLGIPNFGLPGTQLAFHTSALAGLLNRNEVDVINAREREGSIFLSKITSALELVFGEGRARVLLNMTFRIDKPKFGGGNAQVSLIW